MKKIVSWIVAYHPTPVRFRGIINRKKKIKWIVIDMEHTSISISLLKN